MEIKEYVSLKGHNTFGIDVSARFYIQIASTNELQKLVSLDIFNDYPHLILGGGSNILFTRNFDGIVIQIANRGIRKIDPDIPGIPTAKGGEDDNKVLVCAQAGEPWDEVVAYCVNRNWGGLENLSLIPGHTGSSPIQNIGAYGVELKDAFHSLEAIEKSTGKLVHFDKQACLFGYRDSFFKQKGRNRFVITSVTFCLTKEKHIVHTSYGSLAAALKKIKTEHPTIADVRNAVIAIRQSKLPDHSLIGNAGSFFKNPTVSHEKYFDLKKTYPDVVGYSSDSGVKLAAGWLIEKAGWKAYRENDAGVHHRQALVLVNYGSAKGSDIIGLAEKISESIKKQFDIHLHPEVNII